MSSESQRRRRQGREHGCKFCRDFGNRPYGHLRVAAHDDDRGFALIVCPRCGALWQDNFSDDPVPIQPAVAVRKWPWPRLLPAGRAVRLEDGSVGVIVGQVRLMGWLGALALGLWAVLAGFRLAGWPGGIGTVLLISSLLWAAVALSR